VVFSEPRKECNEDAATTRIPRQSITLPSFGATRQSDKAIRSDFRRDLPPTTTRTSQDPFCLSSSMSGTALNPTLFADVLDIVRPLDQLQQVDVGDDLDGEGETIPNLEEGDSNAVAEMLKTVNSVSKGVSEGTHDEYRRCVLYRPADNLIADTRDA
jgi:hypothetical protein